MNWILYINVACVLLFLGLLVWASVSDVRTYRIPNWISLAIAAAYLPFALTSGESTTVKQLLAQGYGVGFAVFAIGFLMFMMKIMGGGDAKLLSAVSIWAGTAYFGNTMLILAVAGGVMALGVMIVLPFRARLTGQAISDKIRKTKLPYGVAISAGGFYAGWQHLQPTLETMGL